MEPKVVQTRPRRPPDSENQSEIVICVFCSFLSSKMEPKRHPKINKNCFGTSFFYTTKTRIFQKPFFPFFLLSGRSQTLKASKPLQRGVKNRRSRFSQRKWYFPKISSKMTPLGHPKTYQNSKNTRTKPPTNKPQKHTDKQCFQGSKKL